MKDDRILRIYTDGACSGNQSAQNFGGWGAILEFAGHSKELYGGEKKKVLVDVKGLYSINDLRATDLLWWRL